MVEEAVAPINQRKIRLSEMHFPALWGGNSYSYVLILQTKVVNNKLFTELLPVLAQSNLMKNKIVTVHSLREFPTLTSTK